MATRHGDVAILTRAEAAAYLRLTVGTLALWARKGYFGLPFIRCGRRARYTRAALDDWLRRRTVNGTKPGKGRRQKAVGADKRDA